MTCTDPISFLPYHREAYTTPNLPPSHCIRLFLGQIPGEISLDAIAHLINDIAGNIIVNNIQYVYDKNNRRKRFCCYIDVSDGNYFSLFANAQHGIVCGTAGVWIANNAHGTLELQHILCYRMEKYLHEPKNFLVLEPTRNLRTH